MRYELVRVGRVRFHLIAGAYKRIALGIAVSKWSFDLDIGPFWLSLEWWRNDS